MIEKLPLVSVVMITYGHENYILEAINGVLIQKYQGPIELIIANDNSPDKTDEVVNNFLKDNILPNNFTVRYTKHNVNKGIMPNFTWALQQSKGKYIALCEGDDYWIDPFKLQKQVDFLESHPNYKIHSARARILRDTGFQDEIGNNEFKETYSLKDILTKNYFITCTVMFRNQAVAYEAFTNLKFGDWILYILLLSDNKSFGFISNDVFSVYRVHEGGAMHSLSDSYKFAHAHLLQFSAIKKYTGAKFNPEQKKYIRQTFRSVLKHDLKNFKLLNIFNAVSMYNKIIK